MAQKKVKVTVAMNPPVLLVDYSRSLKLNGNALIRVEASSSSKSFASIDVVTLLNVSHSMSCAAASPSETPSRLDLLKKAIKFIIRQLGDDDRLAIVAFNDQVIKEYSTDLLETSGGNLMALEDKVDSLMAKGDTAFRSSLEHAVQLLDARVDKSRVGFIILISDGSDNNKFEWTDEGIAPSDPIRALLRKYPVATFGLCKAHDSKALHFIAKESNGAYSSITYNLESKMMEAFAICVAGLKTVVAVDTCINITSGSLNITRIDSGGHTPRGGSGSIFIGMLCTGEVKDFVVYFDYTTGSWRRGYSTVLSGIAARVTYKDNPGRQSSTNTENFSVSLPIHTTDTGTAPANPCPPFPAVLEQVVRFKVLDLLKGILKEFLALKKEAGGGAFKTAEEEDGDPVVQAMTASLLQRKWKEFKQSDESWKEAAPGAFLDLEGIDRDVNAMVAILMQGLGVGCIYSWLSSSLMQRAAVAGLPSDTTATGFCTPAMEAMVQEVRKQLAEEATVEQEDKAVCNNAVELLDMIYERFELWSNLEDDVPPPFHPSSELEGNESRNLAAVLHGDIGRARQKDIYLATDHAIEQWWSSFTAAENMLGHGRTKN